MAAPNIVATTTILGKTAALDLSSASATTLLSNAASSGKVFKVNTVVVANDDGTNAVDVTLSYNSAASGGGTAFKLAHLITIPPKSQVILLDKNSSIYLEEDRSLVITASAASDLDVICSYEDIS